VTNDLLITNTTPIDGTPGDVLIKDGKIAQIGATVDAPDGVDVLDAEGMLLYPSLVDGHSHLDKSLIGMPWYHREGGRDLHTMFADERDMRSSTAWDYERQISRNLEIMIANGATYTRAFADVDTQNGLAGIQAMLALKDKYINAVTMQVIAFPQSGVAARPGTSDVIDEAMKSGADIVGGMDPCLIERDPVRHLDLLFGLAEKHGAGVDVHLHERGYMGAFSAELIIDRAKSTQLPGPIMISHPDFLGDIATSDAERIIDALVDAGVSVTSNAPSSDPKPPLRRMIDVGVNIASGCDGQCDTWAPMNHSDMLQKAYKLAWRNGMTSDIELRHVLDIVTEGGAKAMRLENYGLDVGDEADLLLLPGDVHVEPIATLPTRRTVIKRGRVVAVDGTFTG
jgi:cytosine deaminase